MIPGMTGCLWGIQAGKSEQLPICTRPTIGKIVEGNLIERERRYPMVSWYRQGNLSSLGYDDFIILTKFIASLNYTIDECQLTIKSYNEREGP